MDLHDALSAPATFLEVCNDLSPSLNGAACRRLVSLVDELRNEPDGGSLPADDVAWVESALARVSPAAVQRRSAAIDRLAAVGVRLVTIFAAEYPTNLAMTNDRPPFLFHTGTLDRRDARAVAVVGTRNASAEGLEVTRQVTAELVARSVTIVSGLALGVDTAAHRAAIANGGRTLAVFGTGINRVYPAANRQLAATVAANGACLSQFWPDMPGAQWTFPVRNVVTSGLAIGTVVVEASETSGARIQAEQARRHGKRVFLMEGLVTRQRWAGEMAGQPGVTVVASADQVVEAVELELLAEPALF